MVSYFISNAATRNLNLFFTTVSMSKTFYFDGDFLY